MSAAGSHVIIVGGGASGALLAISLLRGPGRASVTIIEARPLLARGFAYGEAGPLHLLNVRAANMSAYEDAPNDLIDWLDREGVSAGVTGEGRFRFVPRRVFGDYLAGRLDAAALAPAGRGRLQRIHGEATSLRRAAGGITVSLADGRRIAGDIAVLATGYTLKPPADLPHALPSWAPIEPAMLSKLRHVLILGTGHSAIDHVQSLVAAGYAGKITLMSRRGLLPAVHKPIEPADIGAHEIPFGARMSAVWRWIRRRAAEAEAAGGDWRAVLDGLRPHAQALWHSLAPEEQRRYIRHARAWYDVRRHRLAPSITATLESLQAEGRVEVIAGRVLAVTDAGEAAKVIYRRRGASAEETLTVGAIIECTGFDLDPRTAHNPVVSDLMAQGLAQPGPHGFGLKVDASCALIDSNGQVAKDLFAIGPLTRGRFWEIVGLPDIRRQCARLALALAAAPRPAATASA